MIAGAFTWVSIDVSRRQGRLVSNPQFDDITYMDDALGRLQTLQSHGVGALLHDWRETPPHSPVLVVVAMASFAAFGPRDVAPYFANAGTVFLAMLLVDSLTIALAFWQKVACQVFLLSIRWVSMAATVFRPDFLAGIFLAAGIWSILSSSGFASRRRLLLAGAAFGLAAETKPPVGVAMFLAMATTLAFAVGIHVRRGGKLPSMSVRPWRVSTGRIVVPCVAAAAVVSAPLLFDWRGIISYVYDNTFGTHRAVWEFNGTFVQKLTYYLSGPGAVLTFGHNTLLVFTASAAAFYFYVSRHRPDELSRLTASIGVLGALYLVNVVNPTKTAYTGLTFQIPLTFAVILAIADAGAAFQSITVRGVPASAVLFSGFAALAALSFQGPERFKPAELATVVDRKRAADAAVDSILDRVRGSATAQNVFLTGSGDLNAWLLDYRSRQIGVANVSFVNDQFDTTAEAIARSTADADWVVVGSSRCALFSRMLPTWPLQADVLHGLLAERDVQGMPRFTVVARTPSPPADTVIAILRHNR